MLSDLLEEGSLGGEKEQCCRAHMKEYLLPGPRIGGIYGERRESRSLSWQEMPRRDLGGC